MFLVEPMRIGSPHWMQLELSRLKIVSLELAQATKQLLPFVAEQTLGQPRPNVTHYRAARRRSSPGRPSPAPTTESSLSLANQRQSLGANRVADGRGSLESEGGLRTWS